MGVDSERAVTAQILKLVTVYASETLMSPILSHQMLFFKGRYACMRISSLRLGL